MQNFQQEALPEYKEILTIGIQTLLSDLQKIKTDSPEELIVSYERNDITGKDGKPSLLEKLKLKKSSGLVRRKIHLQMLLDTFIAAIEKDNTASGLTNSGALASAGVPGMHTTWKLWITIRRLKMKKVNPVHPGEILLEEFLNPMGITQYRLAKDISVPARRINEIVHGKRAISADTALRLGRFFGTSAQFWLNLQSHFDLEVQIDRIGDKLDHEVHALSVA